MKQYAQFGCFSASVIIIMFFVIIATKTNSPAATVTATPSETAAQRTNRLLTEAFQSVPGVQSVGTVTVLGSDPTIVYGELRVQSGSRTTAAASALQQKAFQQLVTASLEFTVILDDGKVATDFTWDNQTDAWRETDIASAGG